ncbi:MAG: hypothetical protein M1822_004370 [Bathelium mastoideum]|nr:MAG: hypothetical protein M1822_004370 [Bathelium mastoideum]
MPFTDQQSDSSDVERVWTEAINQYCRDTKTDRAEFRNLRNLRGVMDEQERQVKRFESFRHSGKTGDRLRHFVNKNSDIVLSAAKQIGAAASASFPPAATIVTAFTWILKAAKDTSSDYDMIETFFSIMQSFLERISLLEHKLPAADTYQTMLARVFGSLLGLCSIASQYQKDGRFLKWGKALFRGTDPNLKDSVDALNNNIQRLESATLFATLGETIDTHKVATQIGISVSENLAVTQKVLAMSEETSANTKSLTMIAQENSETSQQTLDATQQGLETSRRVEKIILKLSRERHGRLQKDSQDRGKTDKDRQPKDAGARHLAALNQIRNDLSTTAQPDQTLHHIEQSFTKGTFKWLSENTLYQGFVSGTESLVSVTGGRGLGKTNLAYYAIGDLRGQVQEAEDRKNVVYFFFEEEHEQLRSIKDFLKTIVIQIAEGDQKYRDEIVLELQKLKEISDDDGTLIWDKLIAGKYPADAEAKLIIVIDGIDELDSEGRTKLLSLLAQIKKHSLQISVLLTSRLVMEDLEAPSLPLTMDLLRKDVKLIIRDRIKSLLKLKRLEVRARKQIATKLLQKADSERLNSLGREPLIMRELRNLPENLSSLYDVLLDECRKGRTKEDLASLRRLFAWLSYSERQLTLGEASALVKLVGEDHSLSVEEEVDGRLAKLLRVAQNNDDTDGSSDESGSDALESADDTSHQPNLDPSILLPLSFQERALRQYFRELSKDEDGLRSSPSSAHLIIFRTAAMILTNEKSEESTADLPVSYAADYWTQHFLNIKIEDLSDEEVIEGIKSLYAIVSNHGAALEKIEENASVIGIFGDATDMPEDMVNSLKKWTDKFKSLPTKPVTVEIRDWVHDISGDAARLMIQIARQHCYNWFNRGEWQDDASRSYAFANCALRMANSTDQKLALPTDTPTAEQILYVSNAFPELAKASRAYRGIGLALKSYNYYEEGLAQCRKALETSETFFDKSLALGSILQAVVYLAEGVDDQEKDKKNEYIREAKETSSGITALWEKKLEIDDPNMIEHRQVKLGTQAEAALLEDDVDSAIAFVHTARSLLKGDEDIDDYIDVNIMVDLDKVTSKLFDLKEFGKLIQLVENLHDIEKVFWLTNYNDEIFQRAAVESDKHKFLVETYELVLKQGTVPYNGAIRLRYKLADYYGTVACDPEKSKKYLKQILYSNLRDQQTSKSFVLQSRSALARMLMEQFRTTSDSSQKASILDEMKTLATSAVALGEEYSPEMSDTATVHALMLRKLGPLTAFESVLCKSFDACIEALSDDVASNDNRAIRFFGKVLACLPGLQKDAQIALAAQFYWLNPTFKAQAKSEGMADGQRLTEEAESTEAASEPGADSTGPDQQASATLARANEPGPETSSNTMNGQVTGSGRGANLKSKAPEAVTTAEVTSGEVPDSNNTMGRDGKVTSDGSDDIDPAIIEDLGTDDAWIWCNGCSKDFSHSALGNIYTCIICTDTDLCTECYNKRMALNRGEKVNDWRSFCGTNHHYVKHAPEGWRGVKDGVIRIGEEEIAFDQWLRQVQQRWKVAWADFWKAEDDIFDAL